MGKKIKILLLIFLYINSYSQVGIGTKTPQASAIVEFSSNDKGVLLPRINLDSEIDQTTIHTPATGLLVYNLGKGGLKYNGYVFWNGTEWRTLNNTSLEVGALGTIVCNTVNLSPNIYTAGNSYTGTLSIDYTEGNGGVYDAQTIGPINGLTARLASGSFNVGSGTLNYSITGTPTVTSPTTTTFPINIGGKTCNATVGSGDFVSLGELIYYRASIPANLSNVWLSAFVSDLPVLGGKIRLDAFFNASSIGGNGTVSMHPRLVNTSGVPVKLSFSALTTVNRFNAGNYLLAPSTPTGSGNSLAPSAYLNLDDGIYYGYGYNDMLGITNPRVTGSGQGENQEVVTADISLDEKWYRVYYFPILNNNDSTSTLDDTREIYLSVQRLY